MIPSLVCHATSLERQISVQDKTLSGSSKVSILMVLVRLSREWLENKIQISAISCSNIMKMDGEL